MGKIVTPGRKNPWKPCSCYRHLPAGKGDPGHSAMLFSDAWPSEVGLKKAMCQVSWLTRRVVRVGCCCVPRSSSSGSSGAFGHWMGRSVPAGPQGEVSKALLACAARAVSPTHRRYEREEALGRLLSGSPRRATGASMCWQAMGTSHTAAPGVLGAGGVSKNSGCSATYRPSWVRAKSHTDDRGGSCGVAQQWCGSPWTPRRPAHNGATAREIP
jgi:hypothetical protein